MTLIITNDFESANDATKNILDSFKKKNMKTLLTVGQIIYYVDWKKYPTIHEARVTVSTDKLVTVSLDLPICKSYSGGCFYDSYTLNRKFFLTEESARNAIINDMTQLILASIAAHESLVKRANNTLTKPVKKLKI